jgi:hypothetical protein
MKPPTARSLALVVLLVAALAAALWLADAVQRDAPLLQRLRAAAPPPAAAGSVFSPPSSAVDRSLAVTIRPLQPRAGVVFATGGVAPTRTVGTLYERPLLLDVAAPGLTIVRARELLDGAVGPVHSAAYLVGVESTLPILSIAADPPDLWDVQRGILANPWQRGQDWERPVEVTYFEGARVIALPAGLRVHGSEPSAAPKQSLRLYFRNDYGVARLEQPLLPSRPAQEVQSYKRLLLQAGDRSGRWTLLEDQLASEVATELGMCAPQGRFVLLFLNEEPWGIYRLSERVDRFFVADNLGIGSADLIRGGDVEEGDGEHWDGLMDWLAAHDLAEPDNLTTLETQIDVDSFTDYVILQAYFGFPAERFSAVRALDGTGRWFWLLGGWEEGWTLEAQPEATLLTAAADSGDLALLLRRLLENPDYRQRFAARAADLLNTLLSSQGMEERVAGLAAQLRADVHHETARWPSPSGWEGNVAHLGDVVRQRPDTLREQVEAALGLEGSARLTLDSSPEGAGTVFVNGTPVSAFPWDGTYFLGTPVQLVAVPAPGHAFAGWEGGRPSSSPRITLTVDASRTVSARFVPVPDDAALRPNDVMIDEVWINDDGTRYASLGNRPLEGDWLELVVAGSRPVDLRGWRVTDNDTKTGTDEGSIILPRLDALASVPRGSVVLIIATESRSNTAYFGQDDLDARDGRMVLYVGNGNLDVTTDPGFGIGTGDDNVVLLAPGPSPAFADDVGVDFVGEGDEVTPYSFGVLVDGVVFEAPFRGLGADDGALLPRGAPGDDGSVGWIVDPPARESGDDARMDSTNVLTPGAPNRARNEIPLQTGAALLLLLGVAGTLVALALRARRG